ncbi:MAG: hypothetical protein RBS39_07860 [Phycisphaerales bacterium]|jgi:hypothetical protein|nr:hypothetical protein [Phycisphaerales bacterium]
MSDLRAGSLLEGIDTPEVGAKRPPRVPLRERINRVPRTLRAALAKRWRASKVFRFASAGALATLVIGGSIGAYLALRPVPKPDYLEDELDKIFSYTLLTNEFNNLPVEERVELVGQLVSRLGKMSDNDSTLLAAFAAGIAGSAREQLEKNVATLFLDMWDQSALQYDKVPQEERGAFLDETYIGFSKMLEALSGQPRDMSDEERLAEGRKQGQREAEMIRSGRVSSRDGAQFFRFMNERVGEQASPHQRARIGPVMRDMMSRMRGHN